MAIVLHMIDTLALGGAERMAVNIANTLPEARYEVHLCSTRHDGPLVNEIAPHVKHVSLERKWRFDTRAIQQLVAYLRTHRIQIIHAHSSSILLSAFVKQFVPDIKIVWHIHKGSQADNPPEWSYRIAVPQAHWILGVNSRLVEWARQNFRFPPDRISYVPNFALMPPPEEKYIQLPGDTTNRIVCVANLRPQKDHQTLIEALAYVVEKYPAQLLLVGEESDVEYTQQIRAEINRLNLAGQVHFLGQQQDIPNILRASTIGVMSSYSEGFPVALIEYGMCGLAAVSTRVGECEALLMNGEAGMLVPPRSPELLADAMLQLLTQPDYRQALARKFQQHVIANYSANAIIGKLCEIYDHLTPERLP